MTEPEERQPPLTHRPRGNEKLIPKPLSSPKQSLSEGEGSASHAPELEARGSAQDDRSGASQPNGAHTDDLRSFADQLIAIAQQLRSGVFAQDESQSRHTPASHEEAEPDVEQIEERPVDTVSSGKRPGHKETLAQRRRVYGEMARATYAKRRKRAAIFGDPELFGEPAWDILLDLYIAAVEGKAVSVSSACIGSASPPTTGLRWLGVLADQGLVQREHDPDDQRRVLVRLTHKGLSAMDRFFASDAVQKGDQRNPGS